jgi:hypothetical protein
MIEKASSQFGRHLSAAADVGEMLGCPIEQQCDVGIYKSII